MTQKHDTALSWDNTTSISHLFDADQPAPQGALVRDTMQDCDQIAVVYDKGQRPPEITISKVSGTVHTVLADGIAVAVVASATGPAPSPEDVILVERTT